MTRITVYAGPQRLSRQRPEAASFSSDWSEYGPEEALRRIGLEYKLTDNFHNRQVVIVLDPVMNETDLAAVKANVREAAIALEKSGLL